MNTVVNVTEPRLRDVQITEDEIVAHRQDNRNIRVKSTLHGTPAYRPRKSVKRAS